MRVPVLALALALAGTCAGCLEREETITVRADGSLEVVHRVRGGAADLDGGAARYPTGGPFAVTRRTVTRDDGRPEEVVEARAVFAAAGDVPRTFGDGRLGVALERRTEVEVRPEAGGTLCTFERSYGARAWADFQRLHERVFDEGVRALLSEASKGLDGWSADERGQVFGALVAWERGKAQLWADRGLTAVAGAEAGLAEARLQVRDAVAEVFARELPPARAEELLAAAREEPARLRVAVEAVRVRCDEAAVVVAAGALGWGRERPAALRAAIGAEREAFEVTEDLGDERFVVRVRLPGRVVTHDADAVEDGALVWRFTGKELRDRTHVLRATSRLEVR